MLLTQERKEVGRSGVLETAKATVKASSKVFSFFSDNVYSNKFVAICRELVANAWDSHVMANKTSTPVEVWLPSLIDPVFKVRDHGIGMAHEFVMNDFMRYADGSTKDNTNDVIGGFGIGSKSPFAYTDQFTLRSIHGGVESLYSVFKDEEGVPSIALLDQRTTSEPNGVETSFPVEVGDFPSFEEAAFKALRYFDPLPNIVNSTSGAFEPVKYASRGKIWGMRQTSGDLQIIQGGVMYPVDKNNLTHKFKDEVARKLLTFGLDIYVPIGSCSVALNREALAYDDKTIKSLETICLSVVDEVAKSFSTMFDNHATLWEARKALFEEVHPNGNHHYNVSSRGSFLADRALYKGKKLTLQFEFPILTGGMETWAIERKGYRRFASSIPNPRWERYSVIPTTTYDPKVSSHAPQIQPGRYEFVIIDDLPRSPKSKSIMRIKEYVEANLAQQKEILVIRPLDDTYDANAILNALGNPVDHELTSRMPEPAKSISQGGSVRPKIRMFTFTCEKYYDSYRGYQRHSNLNPGPNANKEGVKEIDYIAQPDHGIVVPMESFNLPPNFWERIETKLILPNELHFVNVGDRKKLSDKWVDFEDEFNKRLKAKLKTLPQLGERLAVYHEMDEYFRRLFSDSKPLDALLTKKTHPLSQLFTLHQTYVKPLDAIQQGLAQFVTQKLPAGVNVGQLEGAVKGDAKLYRLLRLLNFRATEIVDVNLIVSVL